MTTQSQHLSYTWRAVLVCLLVLGGLLRLLDLTDPPLDFHSTRQLRNALVARAIYYDHLPNAVPEQRALADSFRRSVGQYEPPVIESLVGFTYLLTGESFIIARVYQTIFWLLAGLALFDLARRISSTPAALLSLAYYLVLPFSVQASRSFQPDPLMTASFVIGIYFLYRWSEIAHESSIEGREGWKWAILAGVFLGFATLVKIVIAFMVGGAVIAMVLVTKGKRFWKAPQVWGLAVLMILPAFIYYVIVTPGRSTEYFFAWTVSLIKLILSPNFYSKWLSFLDSLFGVTILVLSLAGSLLASRHARWLLIGIWIGYLLYGLTLPFQMYTHSYYHIQLIPVVALGLAAAVDPLFERAASLNLAGRAALGLLILAIIGYQAWVARSVLMAEDYRKEPAFWQKVGAEIPADADVIALTQDYGYRLMVWGWRKVSLWPLNTDLSEARGGTQDAAGNFSSLTEGKEYFLVTAFGQLDQQTDLKDILKNIPIATQGDGYVLYDLRK
jgi:4-amino-4-deoxy-L-arabinose transferase-like glycosyltransferase